MHLREEPRLTSLIMAALFALSLGLQGLLTTAADAKMIASASHVGMSSGDEPMDCPGQDGADQASCFAVCAGSIGILFEPAELLFVSSRRVNADGLIMSLRDRSVPPDPYPPRPSALI